MELFEQHQPASIEVKKLRLRAYIGFKDWERQKMQDLVISYSFKYNSYASSQADDISLGVDYKVITKNIIKLIDQQKFDLIETVAQLVLEKIQEGSIAIYDIHVQVEKPHALRFSDNVLVKLCSKDKYKKAMIAMGSNIAPRENIARALSLISEFAFIDKKTDFLKTKAQKDTSQEDFTNGAILVYTQLSFPELQLKLKHIESQCGRIRSDNKNAAREIDLDVTTYNGHLVDQEDIYEFEFLMDFLKELELGIWEKVEKKGK